MTRDRATKILNRMLATIDGGGVPVRIDEVWVFGSYARGAMELGDIDLIIVHEQMSKTLRANLEAEAKAKNMDWHRELYYPAMRHRSMITKPLRKPGERMDILLGWTLKDVLSDYSLAKNGRLVRLWTPECRDWRTAIASIEPNPVATRAARHEFMSCKRAGCSLEDMQRLTLWIDSGAVAVKKIQPPEQVVILSKAGHGRIELLGSLYFGKAARECLPLGAWWLEQHGCEWIGGNRGELNNTRPWPSMKPPTLMTTFGTVHPWRIPWFLSQPQAEAAGHVLHFKKGEPQELLEFRRGPAWAKFDEINQNADEERIRQL